MTQETTNDDTAPEVKSEAGLLAKNRRAIAFKFASP